ncbi:MAG: DUF4293 domain-containing protein [Cyclobacteriaceae bacterium]
MWQRIQTVFLALNVVCMAAGLFFPIWAGQENGVGFRLDPLHFTEFREDGETNIYLPYSITALLMAAAATISFMEIRKFEDRHTQIKMGTLNSLVLMGAMISAVLFANQLSTEHPEQWTYGPTLYILFAGVTFNWLAVRFIRRDEKIVRDADKLR